jgi:O-succinylbenzoic acid--CoA ligase
VSLSVQEAATESPDAIALDVGGATVTFRELAEQVSLRAARLRAVTPEVPDDRPVALVGASDRATLETVYALVTMGRPVLLVHPRLTEAERDAVLELIRPARLVVPEPVPQRDHVLPPAFEPVDDARCLCILMTSGTTGRPKGVVLSRRAFLASARASDENLRLARDDRWLLGLPIAHVGGLSILTRSLLARSAVVVPRETSLGQRLDAGALARIIDHQRVTLASLVPTQLEWLLARDPPWRPPPHLRAVLLGGAAARPSLLERAADRGVPVLTTYGLTEACSQVTTQVVGSVNRGELGSGPPIAGVELRIVDGVIEVRGPTLFDGYVRAPATPVFSADGWFATNDLGRLDASGNLHVVGRRSELVITGGENVHPAEVEAIVERCPGVAAACVFGVPDETWGEILAVAVVGAPGGPPSDTELAAFVRVHLSPHRRPRRVAVIEALAATPLGKLDRAGTRERAFGRLRVL